MRKRLIVIVKPAVKHLDTVHQPLRCGTIVSFSVAKLKMIDGRHQRLFIKTIFHDIFQNIADNCPELFFLVRAGSLGNNTEVNVVPTLGWLPTTAILVLRLVVCLSKFPRFNWDNV